MKGKKIIIILGVVLFIWVVYMGVEYFRCYKPKQTDNKPLLTIKTVDDPDQTKYVGLGFSVVNYKVNITEAKDGTVVKEFNVLGFTLSDTKIKREKK